jgi:hypothetical protein
MFVTSLSGPWALVAGPIIAIWRLKPMVFQQRTHFRLNESADRRRIRRHDHFLVAGLAVA